MMLYSIIIPAYNVEKYIDECLSSVLAQTYSNFEIIVVNDGSTDKTQEIVEEYQRKHNFIKLINQENKGQVKARVAGLSFVNGDYVCYLDADDVWDSDLLEIVNEYIIKNNTDLVIFGAKRIFSNGKLDDTRKYSYYQEESVDSSNKKPFLIDFLFKKYLNSLCLKVIKTELMLSASAKMNDYAHVRRGEDSIQSMFLIIEAKKIGFIDKLFYNYRDNEASMINNYKLSYIQDSCEIRKVCIKEYKKFNIFKDKNILRSYNSKLFKSIIGSIINCLHYPYHEMKLALIDLRKNETYQNAVKCYEKSDLSLKYRIILLLLIGKYDRTMYCLLKLYKC